MSLIRMRMEFSKEYVPEMALTTIAHNLHGYMLLTQANMATIPLRVNNGIESWPTTPRVKL